MHLRFAPLLVAFAASAVVMATTSDARAQSVPPPPPSPIAAPAEETVWYGWQTLLVDGAAIATLVIPPVGVLMYGFGPLIVHAAHGRLGIGMADMFVRVGAPFAFGAIGYGLYSAASTGHSTSQCTEGCLGRVGGFLVGAFVGYVTAVVLDAAVFAREPVVKRPSDAGAYKLRWSPTFSAAPRGGVTAGLGAIF